MIASCNNTSTVILEPHLMMLFPFFPSEAYVLRTHLPQSMCVLERECQKGREAACLALLSLAAIGFEELAARGLH